MDSILTGSSTAWYWNWTGQDHKVLQQVVRSAERTIRSTLPALQDIYSRRCMTRTLSIKTHTVQATEVRKRLQPRDEERETQEEL
ncbi:hypothetical protein LDENG_00115770 [Lucifuga dentata]|nr:hypothetical protein LDENG_00115770 [Lucifuga dentata]